jgi:hypothetical protein
MSAANCVTLSPFGIILKCLPGPDRKRLPSTYTYRITYRSVDPFEPGCVMTWEVSGGRLPYQIALERKSSGRIKWHCTCADAIYRGDASPAHVCKHIQGLIECLPIEQKQSTYLSV